MFLSKLLHDAFKYTLWGYTTIYIVRLITLWIAARQIANRNL